MSQYNCSDSFLLAKTSIQNKPLLRMNALIYPTLDVFIYNLGEGLGDNQDDIATRREIFLETLPPDLQNQLTQAFDRLSTTPNADYVKLLNLSGKSADFHRVETSVNNYNIKGYYYPVFLNETYGLLLGCSVDEKELPQRLSCYRYLERQVDIIPGNLGKTWTISGIIPTSDSDPETLAMNAYKWLKYGTHLKDLSQAEAEAFIPEEWQYRKLGKFLASYVFEVWQIPNNWETMEENSHAIVFLYPSHQIREDATQFYEDWMQLFCYRNKLLWAYGESQKIKARMQAGFQTIRETIATIENQSHLSQLRIKLEANLDTFSNYVIDLNYLELQRHTIEANLHNYQAAIASMKDYIARNPDVFGYTDLKFLEEFGTLVESKYQVQVRKDCESLRPGLEIMGTLIDTIKGIVEIKQAERDRRIERAIVAAAVGVGTTSAAASSSSLLIKELTPLYLGESNQNEYPLAAPLSNLAIALIFSLSLGWLGGWLTWKYLQSR